MNKPIYLDYAAATPVEPEVLRAMETFFTQRFYNPSALYLNAKAVKADLNEARSSIASLLGAKPSEIVFTAGGTEANNLAIKGVAAEHPEGEILVSALEHESVIEPSNGGNVKHIAIAADGRINVNDLEQKITDKTVLISVMYANNEIGTIQPIREITKLTAHIKKQRLISGNTLPLYVHTDAAQAAAYLDLHVSKLGVDLMTINGGKIYGPKQSGLLYIKTGTQLQPQIYGGGQERGYRSGTENVPSIIGLSAALRLVISRQKEETKRLHNLQKLFFEELSQHVPTALINGSQKYRLPNNVHITIPGTDNERVMMELDERGIMCATGSACSASNDAPSHVLAALGMNDETARSSLRFTMGVSTTEEAVKTTVQAISTIVNAA